MLQKCLKKQDAMAILNEKKKTLFSPLTEYLGSPLGITRNIDFNRADYTWFRTIFLTHFRLTECCNFVHNSTPHTHPSPILIGRGSSDCHRGQRESIIGVQWGQGNPNPRVHRSSGKRGFAEFPTGSVERGLGFPGSTVHQ